MQMLHYEQCTHRHGGTEAVCVCVCVGQKFIMLLGGKREGEDKGGKGGRESIWRLKDV